MKHNFTIRQVNSPFEDTAFFVRNVYKKQAFLLDCGRLGSLTNTEVLGISDIFISHTHIDHFYGFDRILRGSIRADKTVRVFGPPGIIANVKGKIDAYTWNLIHNYTFALEVIELSETGTFQRGIFSAADGFVPHYETITPGTIELEDGFTLDFAFFDHDVTSVGYRIRESRHINIIKDMHKRFGYRPGPWLGELKMRLRRMDDPGSLITVDSADGPLEVTLGQLENDIVLYREPQDVTFITDVAPTLENYHRAVDFAANSHILLIEGMFLREDVMHAVEKRHLTLQLAKDIYHRSNSRYVRFFHFAPRYDRDRSHFFSVLREGLAGRVFS